MPSNAAARRTVMFDLNPRDLEQEFIEAYGVDSARPGAPIPADLTAQADIPRGILRESTMYGSASSDTIEWQSDAPTNHEDRRVSLPVCSTPRVTFITTKQKPSTVSIFTPDMGGAQSGQLSARGTAAVRSISKPVAQRVSLDTQQPGTNSSSASQAARGGRNNNAVKLSTSLCESLADEEILVSLHSLLDTSMQGSGHTLSSHAALSSAGIDAVQPFEAKKNKILLPSGIDKPTRSLSSRLASRQSEASKTARSGSTSYGRVGIVCKQQEAHFPSQASAADKVYEDGFSTNQCEQGNIPNTEMAAKDGVKQVAAPETSIAPTSKGKRRSSATYAPRSHNQAASDEASLPSGRTTLLVSDQPEPKGARGKTPSTSFFSRRNSSVSGSASSSSRQKVPKFTTFAHSVSSVPSSNDMIKIMVDMSERDVFRQRLSKNSFLHRIRRDTAGNILAGPNYPSYNCCRHSTLSALIATGQRIRESDPFSFLYGSGLLMAGTGLYLKQVPLKAAGKHPLSPADSKLPLLSGSKSIVSPAIKSLRKVKGSVYEAFLTTPTTSGILKPFTSAVFKFLYYRDDPFCFAADTLGSTAGFDADRCGAPDPLRSFDCSADDADQTIAFLHESACLQKKSAMNLEQLAHFYNPTLTQSHIQRQVRLMYRIDLFGSSVDDSDALSDQQQTDTANIIERFSVDSPPPLSQNEPMAGMQSELNDADSLPYNLDMNESLERPAVQTPRDIETCSSDPIA